MKAQILPIKILDDAIFFVRKTAAPNTLSPLALSQHPISNANGQKRLGLNPD
jgi:hypothetical protein